MGRGFPRRLQATGEAAQNFMARFTQDGGIVTRDGTVYGPGDAPAVIHLREIVELFGAAPVPAPGRYPLAAGGFPGGGGGSTTGT